jgi:hypothetical protein
MKTNIKIINSAIYFNMLGNFFIGYSILGFTFVTFNYIHNFNNILRESKKALITNSQIFTKEEFKALELKSKSKAREELLTLFLGDYLGQKIYRKLI